MIPILFEIGPFRVGSFGLMMVIAFLICVYFIQREFKKSGFQPEWAVNIVFVGALCGIVGARLYFILEYFSEFLRDPLSMLLSGSGLTWYGGFIAGFIGIVWMIYRLPAPTVKMADIIAPIVLLGYGIGRIGCLLAGDGDYGFATNVPWAMSFPNGLVPTEVAVHPTPIYDTLMSFTAFLILWNLRKKITIPGFMVSGLFFCYGIIRFISEFFRTTPKVLFGWMSMAQIISVLSIVFAILCAIYYNKKASQGKVVAVT